MERAYIASGRAALLEDDTWGAPHPKAAVAGPRPEPPDSTLRRLSLRRGRRWTEGIGRHRGRDLSNDREGAPAAVRGRVGQVARGTIERDGRPSACREEADPP